VYGGQFEIRFSARKNLEVEPIGLHFAPLISWPFPTFRAPPPAMSTDCQEVAPEVRRGLEQRRGAASDCPLPLPPSGVPTPITPSV